MDTATLKNIDKTVNQWLKEAHTLVYQCLQTDLTVEQKTSRLDLVTNVDKQVEQLLRKKISSLMPAAKIIGEENDHGQVKSMAGAVWFIDPIDGTMNFIKQHDDFAIMLALYIDNQPILGWIMDVAKNKIYHGGPQLGVWCDTKKIPVPADITLNEGLIELSASRLLTNEMHFMEIAKMSSGVRINGSAGISFIKVLEGKMVGYASKMKPWDFAAAKVLLETNKILVTTIDGKEIDMLLSSTVLSATASAHKQIVQLQQP
ncbi:inositol monophosphatase family protein [Periweissella fabalis]|uniref:Inositol monophosphatase family protein n=1 Tax=Periweissella fabalis TaxID=1070421 RepID=A0A7X6N3K9_9LACO|nr:inositol monophosphatase family protein [Periweissella fabalis]MCM0598963.1 inositol monophosphatase family protein [Periweissella fabalis]NKZ23243.1 inositol monophosphatase family protein [Periweissella fabalis]